MSNNMIQAGVATRRWPSRLRLQPCSVSVVSGLCRTAACQAGADAAAAVTPERCRFVPAETGMHLATMQVRTPSSAELQKHCW